MFIKNRNQMFGRNIWIDIQVERVKKTHYLLREDI